MFTSFQQIKQAVRDKYAWPGGYPLYLVMNDGESLCIDCARKEWRQIVRSELWRSKDGWKAQGPEINWEDASLFCAHCDGKIEAAYVD